MEITKWLFNIAMIGAAGAVVGWLKSKWLSRTHERYTKEVPESQKELTYYVDQKRVFRVEERFDVAFSTCKSALGLIKKSKIKKIDVENRKIIVSVGMTYRSLGEKLTISVKEISPHIMEVCIESKPRIWTTTMDYGKGFDNVEIISAYIKAKLLVLND